MKSAWRFIPVAVLLAAAVARSQDAAEAAKPYAQIVQRNVFNLVPIPPPADPASLLPPPEPPPKITPNGIMTIFGQLQVLFKVAVKPPPGQPAKESSYVMSAGERQDDIEVVKIDEPTGVITFNNHGTVQELPLVATPASSGAPQGVPQAGTLVTPGMPPLPRSSGAYPAPGGNALTSIGGRGGNPSGYPSGMSGNSSGNNPGAAGTMNFNSGQSGGINYIGGNPNAQTGEQLSPEAAVLMVEAQRAQFLKEHNPAAIILPTTPLTSLHNPPQPAQ